MGRCLNDKIIPAYNTLLACGATASAYAIEVFNFQKHREKNTISRMAHLVRPQNKQLKFLFQTQEYLMTHFSYENITNVNNISFI